jgi:hypothetical protein
MPLANRTPQAVSTYLPQFFVGLFFLSAAYVKATNGFFGPFPAKLAWDLENWKTSGAMPSFYYPISEHILIPHADSFAVLVIFLQALIGIMLIANKHVRLAGILIFFTQLNIVMAVYNHLELRVLNGQAMLIGIYFFANGEMRGTVWRFVTYALGAIGLLHLYGRYLYFGDPWLTAFFWQRAHFSEYVMSSWPGLKYFTLWLTSGTSGPILWASFWWIKLILILGLFTRYRLQTGIAFLLLMTMITMVWLNVFSCEGVFWVLTMYLWVTHEHDLQRENGTPTTFFT